MTYRLAWLKRAEKDLAQLEKPIADRVRSAIDDLGETPRPHGCRKLRGALEGYRIRIGDWRATYEVDDQAKVVTVTRVGHRSEIYE